ncbi:HEPN domain-containing protein [Spirosoma aerophilum]
MNDEVKVLMSRAYDNLSDAELLCREKRYNSVTNRAYYAIFDADNAILRLKDLYANTHSGLSYTFNLNFVRTEQFSQKT